MKKQHLLTLILTLCLLIIIPTVANAQSGGDLDSADAQFMGEAANDLAGRRVALVGDVNGDGYDDILIGAQKNADGGTDAGAAYLILGGDGG